MMTSYNKNDVYATNEFLEITLGRTDNPLYKGKNKIALRTAMSKKVGFNMLNYNDIKIRIRDYRIVNNIICFRYKISNNDYKIFSDV